MYQNLAESSVVQEEDSDIRINITAVAAQSIWSAGGPPALLPLPHDVDLDTFEMNFNTACVALSQSHWRQAELLLRKALGLPLMLLSNARPANKVWQNFAHR